jgi:hypothetical protein
MMRRWISEVPSNLGRSWRAPGKSYRHTRATPDQPLRMGYRCPFRRRARVPGRIASAMHCRDASHPDGILLSLR